MIADKIKELTKQADECCYGEPCDVIHVEDVKQILQALIEREEEMLNITKEVQRIHTEPEEIFAIENAVIAKQDTIDYLKSELAKISN